MPIWKEPTPAKKEPSPMPTDAVIKPEPARIDPPAPQDIPRRTAEVKESFLAENLTIEGKIEGAGHVRLAGRFKGDVNVQGHLTIEAGAKLTGGVRANTVVIGGELDGNIEAAARVELLSTGVLNGDLKAGSLTVAAGSRMRGQVEFGWEEKSQKPMMRVESGASA